MQKIGIMGGSFNPIHIGHLMLAEWAMDAVKLDEIWFIPAGVTRNKADSYLLDGEERLRMVQLATEGNARMRCLDTEIRRTGFTYTYETLEELKKQVSADTQIYFIMGADCLDAFAHWMEPGKILQNAALIAATRADADMESMKRKAEELMQRYGGNIILMPFVSMSISSTEIRQRIAEGKTIRFMVPDKVEKYIEEKGFYRV